MNHRSYAFASDNTAPAAPEILVAIARVNTGSVASYGEDAVTAEMQHALAAAFDRQGFLAGWPTLNGKAANHLSLLAITQPGGIVFCHPHAHILIDEDGGPARYSGTTLQAVGPDDDGRMTVAALHTAIADIGTLPAGSAVSLTQTTEAGTVYSLDEIRRLVAVAKAHDMRVHLDGARLANAVVALGRPLADLTWRAGVDIVSLGATKNGGMMAEAVVCFDDAVAERFAAERAWTGHIPSKMRFLSAQITAWLADDGWRARAAHANDAASRLAAGLVKIPGVRLVRPVQTNHVFAALPAPIRAALDRAGYVLFAWPQFGEDVIRFVTNWTTPDEDIDKLLAELSFVGSSPA